MRWLLIAFGTVALSLIWLGYPTADTTPAAPGQVQSTFAVQ